MQSHICKVYTCLAVTCHLHLWQNDRDLLRATAVTRCNQQTGCQRLGESLLSTSSTTISSTSSQNTASHQPTAQRTTRHIHDLTYDSPSHRTAYRHKTFFPRTIPEWNSLPGSPSLIVLIPEGNSLPGSPSLIVLIPEWNSLPGSQALIVLIPEWNSLPGSQALIVRAVSECNKATMNLNNRGGPPSCFVLMILLGLYKNKQNKQQQ